MNPEAARPPFEMQVTLDAPVEAVWKALADGEELRRWFPIDARVTPPTAEKAGSIFLSWGPGCEGEGPIAIWEPQKRLLWTESHEGGAVMIGVDFHLEGRGGQTVLRLVHSGFGRGAKWDDYYDSISNGWKFELSSLKHYLDRHRGRDRVCTWMPTPSAMPMAQVWKAIAPEGALVSGGSLDGHTEGGAYRFTGPDRRVYSGKVLRSVANKVFAGTVSELDDAVMRIEIERNGEGTMPFFWLSVWGEKGKEVPAIGEAWRAAMAACVGSAEGMPAPEMCAGQG